ncbi:MAG: response regulator transcription factor [Syntrophomonadaceae bacterium]|nr:response regulator transcription factor [Syntrophomonadaceae bacterium]MDD3023971.1 response regulator transcription factor [Syntrophomonadaceae bacterium]
MINTLLVVEDEEQLRKMLVQHLEADGFRVLTASDGQEAVEAYRNFGPDLVILDIMLPLIPGMEVLKKIRSVDNTPVIILTARGDEIDRLLGLELGADDYMSKPFSPRELSARVRAVLRRSRGGDDKVPNQVKGLSVDLLRQEVMLKDQLLSLTTTEFKIIALLSEHPGQVFSRLQILERIYGDIYEGYERTIDTHINNLRRKMEANGDTGIKVKTVYGAGYKLVEEGSSNV